MRATRTAITCLTAFLLAFGAGQESADTPAPPPADAPEGAGASAEGSEARPFAALVIVSGGRQTYDITTGKTVLPDGGSVVDSKNGVTVDAEHIEYVDGEYIQAAGVSVTGSFGEMSADSLQIDIQESVLTAEGGLTLEREGLALEAVEMRYFALEQVIVFDGGVQGVEPPFYADRLLLDALTGDVLLDGTYTFTGDLFTMRSPEAGGRLQLSPQNLGDELAYSAATEVSPAILERFRAYL